MHNRMQGSSELAQARSEAMRMRCQLEAAVARPLELRTLADFAMRMKYRFHSTNVSELQYTILMLRFVFSKEFECY